MIFRCPDLLLVQVLEYRITSYPVSSLSVISKRVIILASYHLRVESTGTYSSSSVMNQETELRKRKEIGRGRMLVNGDEAQIHTRFSSARTGLTQLIETKTFISPVLFIIFQPFHHFFPLCPNLYFPLN